jgi:hypothetical protein
MMSTKSMVEIWCTKTNDTSYFFGRYNNDASGTVTRRLKQSDYESLTRACIPVRTIVIRKGRVTMRCTSAGDNGETKTLTGNHAATFAVHQDGVWSLHMPAAVFVFVRDHIHAGAFGNCYERYGAKTKDDMVRVWKIPRDLHNIKDYTPPPNMVNFVGTYGGYSKYRIDTVHGPVAWLYNNIRKRNYLMISMSLFTKDFDKPTKVELAKINTMIKELGRKNIVAVLDRDHHAVMIRSVIGLEAGRIRVVAKFINKRKAIMDIIAKAVQINAHDGGTRDRGAEVNKLCRAWLTSKHLDTLGLDL